MCLDNYNKRMKKRRRGRRRRRRRSRRRLKKKRIRRMGIEHRLDAEEEILDPPITYPRHDSPPNWLLEPAL